MRHERRPGRGGGPFPWPERAASVITDPFDRMDPPASVAEAVAATDPDRAEQIIRTITDADTPASALAAVKGGQPRYAGNRQ